MTSHWIQKDRVAYLTEKLNKLVRRASRCGVEAITFRFTGVDQIKYDEETGAITSILTEVVVEGDGPKIDGFKLVARIDHGEAGNTIRAVPGGPDLPVRFRTASPDFCEHCQTSRRRLSTFVLRHEDGGSYHQIGRNCLADFLGRDPNNAIGMAQLAIDIDEACRAESENGGGPGDYMDMRHFLAVCAMVARMEGRFVTRKQAEAYENAKYNSAD